jgi:ATP-dependent Clp protease protease subunit
MKSNHKVFELFHETNCLITKRLVYFGSEHYDEDDCGETGVDFASASKLIKNLLYLDRIKKGTIYLFFNSPGGDWHHGMAIYDCILGLRSKVIFTGFGYVRSMGSIIMQACDKRYLTPNCKVMIHDGTFGHYDIPKSTEAWAEESKKTRQKMYQIYYDGMIKKDKNITLKRIEDMCSHDFIIEGEDAVKIGLADKVLK